MKKILISLFAICMMAVSGVAFISCSSDDDDNEGGKAPSIEGTWEGNIKTGYITTNGHTKDIYATVTLKVTKTQFDVTYDGDQYSYTYVSKYNSISNKPYIVVSKGSQEMGALYYEVAGSTLKFTGTDGSWGMGYLGEYTKK